MIFMNRTMKVVIFGSDEEKVYTFDNWIIPLPLVGDMVLTPSIVKIDGLEIKCGDVWIVKERVFDCEENTVNLYCELN